VFNEIRVAAASKEEVAVDADMYQAMVSMCATCGRADAALALYGQMKEEGGGHVMESADVELFNSLLSACKKGGAPEKMRAVLDGMVERGIKPNLKTYNEMISVCKKAGSPQDAFAIWDEMKGLGIAGDAVTYSALIAACDVVAATGSGVDLYPKGVALLQDMKKAGLRPTVHAYTSLISMCGKRGRVDDGYAFFDEMKASGVALDVASYNALMSACARNRDIEKAHALLKEMVKDPALKPDHASFTTLINAYAQDSATWQQENLTNTIGSPRQKSNMLAAFALLNDMKELGLEPSLSIYKALIDLSVKAGRLDRVKHTIHLMKGTNRYKDWLSRNYPRD
jgi:pentatricopeptide repeat protein